MAASSVDVLALTKSRLRLQDSSLDDLFAAYVEEIGLRILNYCNLDEVPDGLRFVWSSMTMDVLKVEQANLDVIIEATGGSMNVKIGDTQTAPASRSAEVTDTSKSAIDRIVLNYSIDLNRYRKLRW